MSRETAKENQQDSPATMSGHIAIPGTLALFVTALYTALRMNWEDAQRRSLESCMARIFLC